MVMNRPNHGFVTSKSGLNSPRRSAIILDLNMQADVVSKHKNSNKSETSSSSSSSSDSSSTKLKK